MNNKLDAVEKSSDELIEKFEELLLSTKRERMDKLIEFIRKSDFYTAPASTRYHSCHEGGLLEHSMKVYECLSRKLTDSLWADKIGLSEENCIIVALLHDICKTYFYTVEWKNKKVYSDDGLKKDEKGFYDWVSVPGYTVDDKIPYGHGEKSVMMIEEFFRLEPVERYAIRWHMGFSEPKENWNVFTAAVKKYPAVLAVVEADIEATYLLESED